MFRFSIFCLGRSSLEEKGPSQYLSLEPIKIHTGFYFRLGPGKTESEPLTDTANPGGLWGERAKTRHSLLG